MHPQYAICLQIYISSSCNSGLGQCRDYGNLDNGYRIIDGTTEGSTVAFGCNDGYDLLGNRQLTCRSSGLWRGAWPLCVRCEYTIQGFCNGCLHRHTCVRVAHACSNVYNLNLQSDELLHTCPPTQS